MYKTRSICIQVSWQAADAVGLRPMHFSHEHQNTNHPNKINKEEKNLKLRRNGMKAQMQVFNWPTF